MMKNVTFVIKKGEYDNQTYSTIMFDKWGEPLDNDIRFVEEWEQIVDLNNLKNFIFLFKSGTLFLDIQNFFYEINKLPSKFGFGHLIYSNNEVYLNDQALLIESNMIPENFNKQKNIDMPDFTISTQNIHDDYTPIFIKNSGKKIEKNVENKFGKDIIANYLKKKGMFLNFNKQSRQFKIFYYKNKNNIIFNYFSEYNTMIENTLWIFNNETFKKIKKENVLMTGGGLSWLWQVLQKDCNSVTICDISKIQILFIKELIDTWDGKNYGEFVYNFIKKNKIIHFHLNFFETQNKKEDRMILLKNKEEFCKSINKNFLLLFQKYVKNNDFSNFFLETKKQKKIIIKNSDILDEAKNFKIDQINFSNVTNFKYNFCNNKINKIKNFISPATNVFIKNIKQSTKKYFKNNIPPCVKLELDVPINEIYKEIINIKKYLVPHRENSGIGWTSFCIHGQSYNRTREESCYKDILPYNWTKEAKENMPKTINWLKSLKIKNLKRIRVMCLEPYGFINLHHDQKESKLGPINIAITHPKDCKFYLENYGNLEFSPGVAYMMNLINYHCVINEGIEDRYHIIIHGDTDVLLSRK